MKGMITKRYYLGMILVFLGFLNSCQKEDYRENYPLPFHGNIYSYDLGAGQVGSAKIINTYDENKVEVEVEYGTDLSNLISIIKISPGATIEPASGASVDFSQDNQVIYTVTAPSGRVYEWTVVVIEQEDPNAIKLELIPNIGNWADGIEVFSDLSYNKYLTRSSGWNGGDGAVSLGLPDGSTLWSFQDSFFGNVTVDRIRQNNAFTRNAGFLQLNQELDSYVQLNPVTSGETGTWIEYPGANENNDDKWYWGGPAQIIGNEVQMLFGHVENGFFGAYHVSTDVAIYELPDMTFKELIQDKYVGSLTWDSSIFKSNDGYTYLYASEGYGICASKVYSARVEGQDLRGTWEYFTINGWVSSPPENNEDFEVVLDANATQPNVFAENGKYYMVSQSSCYGLDINIWESDSPSGPFTNQRTIYKIPEKYTQDSMQGPGYITYNAVVHPSLSLDGELVISYNINPIGFEHNFNTPGSADNYRPYFVRVYNWK